MCLRFPLMSGLVLLVVLLSLPYPGVVFAASSADVPVHDVTYQYLDILASTGCLPSYNSNQRPIVRGEVVRLVLECEEQLVPTLTTSMRRYLRWLRAEYRDLFSATTFHVNPFDDLGFAPAWVSAASRAVPSSNGLGSVSATTDPLTVNSAGRLADHGAQFAYETLHRTRLSHFVSAQIRPRFLVRDQVSATNPNHVETLLYEALLKAEVANIEFAVGRGQMVWGPSASGGLLFSANAPPYDMVRVSTPRPFRLPWIFRHIGQLRTSMFFADLGTGFQPAHTILSGYRLDIQPVPWLIFGINHGLMVGGEGRRDPNVGEAILEFSGIAGAFAPGQSGFDSNNLFGVDLAVRIPQWRGMTIYGVHAFDDPDKNLEIQFDQEAAWIGGVHVPRLTSDGRWGLRAEYQRTGLGVYRHGTYQSGWASRGAILGGPYGADTNAGTITMTYARPNYAEWSYQAGFVHRSGDAYSTLIDATGDRSAIIKTTDDPDEYSAFGMARVQLPIGQHALATVRGGYEHVWNYAFTKGDNQHVVSADVGLTFRIGKTWSRP